MNLICHKKQNKGVTLIALAITIVILLIIASIGVYNGKEIIKRARVEELKTDMLLIQAKAREYLEEAIFKMGINPDETKKAEVRNKEYVEEAKLTQASDLSSSLGITDLTNCYQLTEEAMKSWGLEGLETPDKYIIQFKEDSVSVEIYYIPGYQGKYSLSEIDKLEQ